MEHEFVFEIKYFKTYDDGAVTAWCEADGASYTVDLEIYINKKKNGKIKADVFRESTDNRSGSRRIVYLNLPDTQRITTQSVHTAVSAFLLSEA